jgi:DNA recombination protein RmuC
MDPIVSIILALAIGVALGALIGWLYASRTSAADAARAGRSDELQRLLDAVTAERDEALQAKAAMQADARNFETRMADLQKSRDELINQFREVGDKLLEKAHQDFLAKAGERFSEADKASEVKLKALLQPVETTLKRYEEGLQRVEKERVDHYAGLREAVELVRAGQGQSVTKPATSSTRSAPAPRPVVAGANKVFATYWNKPA